MTKNFLLKKIKFYFLLTFFVLSSLIDFKCLFKTLNKVFKENDYFFFVKQSYIFLFLAQ